MGWDGKDNFSRWGKQGTFFEYPIAQGKISRRELPYLYNSADIVLGMNILPDTETHTSFRPYEVLGSGAFHLTREDNATDNVFGSVIPTFNESNFMEKVTYYLNNPAERKKIAEEGRKFVMNGHTYQDRARVFVDTIRKAGIL